MKDKILLFEKEETERVKKNHLFFGKVTFICISLSLAKSFQGYMADEDSFLLIPMSFGIIIMGFLIILIRKVEDRNNNQYFGAALQISANLLSLSVTMLEAESHKVFSIVYLYLFSVMALIFLNRKFIVSVGLLFLFMVIAFLLIFKPDNSLFEDALFGIILCSILIFTSLYSIFNEIKDLLFWKTQSAKHLDFSQNLLKFFPEVIFAYTEKKGFFNLNQTAKDFKKKHRYRGDIAGILAQMLDYENETINLLQTIKKFYKTKQKAFLQNQKKLKICSTKIHNFSLDVLNLKDKAESAQLKRNVYEVKLIDYTRVMNSPEILVVIVNVTEKLEHQQAKLAAQNKNILICSVSHEVRTPLNHIFGKFFI
jgi:hypothetical protein